MGNVTTVSKACTKCGGMKALDYFHRDARSPDGRVANCKECVKSRTKAYYDAHRKEMIRNAVEWNAAHKQVRRAINHKYNHSQTGMANTARYTREHRDKIRQIKLRNAAKHKDRYDKNRRAYYIEHRDIILTRSLEWQKNNPSKVSARENRRRAQKRKASVCDFTAEGWILMQGAYDHRCVYCGDTFKGKLTQDHIIPLCKGGAHTESNIVPACRRCNCKKHRNAPPPFVILRPDILKPIALN